MYTVLEKCYMFPISICVSFSAFISLCISFGIMYVDLSSSTLISPQPGSVRSTDEPIESIIFIYVFLYLLFPFDFYIVYISAELPHLFIHVVPIFHYFLCLSLDYSNKVL